MSKTKRALLAANVAWLLFLLTHAAYGQTDWYFYQSQGQEMLFGEVYGEGPNVFGGVWPMFDHHDQNMSSGFYEPIPPLTIQQWQQAAEDAEAACQDAHARYIDFCNEHYIYVHDPWLTDDETLLFLWNLFDTAVLNAHQELEEMAEYQPKIVPVY